MKTKKVLYRIALFAALLAGMCGIKSEAHAASDATPSDAVAEEKNYTNLKGSVEEGKDKENPSETEADIEEVSDDSAEEKAEEDSLPKIPRLTVYNGIDYSAVYDYDYYISRYADIKKAFNGDEEKTLKHFVTYGMNEKRQASADFDIRSYANKYQDLRNAFGEDALKYYVHFINYGKKEGRTATGTASLKNPVTVYSGVDYKDVYDYDYYTSVYKDIKNAFSGKTAPDIATLNHFITYGAKEKRQASSKFDIKSYVNEYQDLRRAFGTDWNKYLTHYEKYGKKEGRKTVGTTVMKNCLTVFTGKDSSGKVTTTDYSDVYDYNYYLGKYGDLNRAFKYDDAGALKHFVNYGMNEGRQGKETFDLNSYKRSYQDLRVAFYKDNKKYYEHYINYGKNEGRKAVGETVLCNPVTIKSNVDFAPVYDYYYYIEKYQDLKKAFGEDDIATLNHFIKYGMNEGRTAKAKYSSDDYTALKEKADEIAAKEDIERLKARGRAMNPTAAAILDSIGWDLEKAHFYTARNIKYYGKYIFDESWGSSRLAQYGLENKKGNCYVFAGVFYEFARVLGYDAHQIAGHIPNWHGGEQPHSWVEIVKDGKVYYCDPEQEYEHSDRDSFMRPYGAKGLWKTMNYHRMN